MAKSSDPLLLGVSIRYLSELGGKSSLPVLKGLLTHGPQNLSDALLKRAVDAVQRIGLREIDAKKGAEDILVEVFKRHASFGVRDHARWQLGPYQNEEALKSLENQVQDLINENKRTGRGSSSDFLIELARDRLQFEQWAKAIDALKKATGEDDKGLRVNAIEPLRATALVGLGKLPEAAKILRTLTADERDELLKNYPVLEKIAKDPAYKDLFSPR